MIEAMRRRIHRVVIATLCTVMLITGLLCGCSVDSLNNVGGGTSATERADIGMCLDTFVVERWLKDRDVFTYTATNLGMKVEVQNANGEVEKQREQIQHFIDMKAKAIVIVAVDADLIVDLVKKAHDAGIKVIAYDRVIENAPIDLYISFDDHQVGHDMATAIADALDKLDSQTRNVIMICGANTDKNVAAVEAGFMEVVEERNLNITAKYYVEGWRPEKVDAFFEENPEILNTTDAIMCGNDSIAGEVIQILAAKRLAGTVVVTGQDADLDACQRIVEGTQYTTIYKAVEQLAKLAAEYTTSLIKEGSLSVTTTVNNGYGDIKYVALTTQLVDKENMDSVIVDSGFHLKEDIYINIGL